MTLERTIARNIRLYRLRSGLTQSGLAKRIPCDQSLISLAENGHSHISLETLAHIADALGVPAYKLLADEVTIINM